MCLSFSVPTGEDEVVERKTDCRERWRGRTAAERELVLCNKVPLASLHTLMLARAPLAMACGHVHLLSYIR